MVNKSLRGRLLTVVAGALVALVGGLLPAGAQAEPTSVLVWTGTYGFRHPSITQAQIAFTELDQAHPEFTVRITENPAELSAVTLASVDVLVWVSTTGKPPMTEQQRADVIRWAACGGGTLAFHAAADSNYGWAEYAELIGAQFDSHPYTGQATMLVEDNTHTITEGWAGKDSFQINDEWYRWRAAKRIPGVSLPRNLDDVHVLLSLEETTVPDDIQEGPLAYEDDQPIAWTKSFRDRGRVYYNNMGHSEATWSVPEFQTSIVNGINWVDDVPLDADCFAGDAALPAGPVPPAADPASVGTACAVPEIGERSGGTWETSGPIKVLRTVGDTVELPSAGIPGNLGWGAQGYVLDLSEESAAAADVTVTLDIPVPSDDYDLSVTAPWGWYGSDAAQGASSEEVVVKGAPHCAVLWLYGDNLYGTSQQAPSLTVAVEPVEGPPGPVARDLEPACPEGRVPPAGYQDVDATSPHARAVDCVTWWEVADGKSAERYDPKGAVTRAQVASFAVRTIEATGMRLQADDDHFADDDGNVHEEAINKLASAGIVSGKSARRYAPGLAVTRGELATILSRSYELAADTELDAGTDYFRDDDGTTHEAGINKLAGAGIATGTGPSTFSPGRSVARDQTASFLARTLAQLVDDGKATPPDETAE